MEKLFAYLLSNSAPFFPPNDDVLDFLLPKC